jgi:hypothetical protein
LICLDGYCDVLNARKGITIKGCAWYKHGDHLKLRRKQTRRDKPQPNGSLQSLARYSSSLYLYLDFEVFISQSVA